MVDGITTFVADALRAVFGSQQRLWLIAIVLGVTLLSLHGRLRSMRERKAIRSLTTDLVYASFYVLGIYGFLIIGPVFRGVEAFLRRWAPFLELNLLAVLHPSAQLLFAYIVVDGFAYGAHRLAHGRMLWPFHSIHHTQRELSPLTNYRFHFVDIAWMTLARAAAAFLLGLYGLNQPLFLPLALVPPLLELLAHSGFSCSYGPLGRVLVSPRFHALHHSADEAHYDRNYGLMFSFWDDLFRSSERRADVPVAYGVRDVELAESFSQHQLAPFIRRPAARPVPAVPSDLTVRG